LKSFEGEKKMATHVHTYLKSLIGVEINEEANKRTFIFQKERFGFKRSTEIVFLKEVNPEIRKEIVITDDELVSLFVWTRKVVQTSRYKHVVYAG